MDTTKPKRETGEGIHTRYAEPHFHPPQELPITTFNIPDPSSTKWPACVLMVLTYRLNPRSNPLPGTRSIDAWIKQANPAGNLIGTTHGTWISGKSKLLNSGPLRETKEGPHESLAQWVSGHVFGLEPSFDPGISTTPSPSYS